MGLSDWIAIQLILHDDRQGKIHDTTWGPRYSNNQLRAQIGIEEVCNMYEDIINGSVSLRGHIRDGFALLTFEDLQN